MRAVSIARSETRIQFEAPFIGVAISDSVVSALDSRGLTPQKALILGFGSVASCTPLKIQRPQYGYS